MRFIDLDRIVDLVVVSAIAGYTGYQLAVFWIDGMDSKPKKKPFKGAAANVKFTSDTLHVLNILDTPIGVTEMNTPREDPCRVVFSNSSFFHLLGDTSLAQSMERRKKELDQMSVGWKRALKVFASSIKQEGCWRANVESPFFPGGAHGCRMPFMARQNVAPLTLDGSDNYILSEMSPEKPVRTVRVNPDGSTTSEGLELPDTLMQGVARSHNTLTTKGSGNKSFRTLDKLASFRRVTFGQMIRDFTSGKSEDGLCVYTLQDLRLFDQLTTQVVILGRKPGNGLRVLFSNKPHWKTLGYKDEGTYNRALERYLAPQTPEASTQVASFIQRHLSDMKVIQRARMTWPTADGGSIQMLVTAMPATINLGKNTERLILVQTAFTEPRRKFTKDDFKLFNADLPAMKANTLRKHAVVSLPPTMMFKVSGELIYCNRQATEWLNQVFGSRPSTENKLEDLFTSKGTFKVVSKLCGKEKGSLELTLPRPDKPEKFFFAKITYSVDVCTGSDAIWISVISTSSMSQLQSKFEKLGYDFGKRLAD